jgi:xylose isomerase
LNEITRLGAGAMAVRRLDADAGRELDQLPCFVSLVVEHQHKIGLK